MGYLMMCLGLVELALSTTRCADWDYAKREGAKSCWDRPGAGGGETELNRLFCASRWLSIVLCCACCSEETRA